MLNTIFQFFALPIHWFKMANSLVYAHAGFWGQLAFDLLLFYLLFLIAFKVTQVVIKCVFYVVVPSLVLSFVSSFILPFGFAFILPVCVALLIVINIVRSYERC
jgi:hypothetical protein